MRKPKHTHLFTCIKTRNTHTDRLHTYKHIAHIDKTPSFPPTHIQTGVIHGDKHPQTHTTHTENHNTHTQTAHIMTQTHIQTEDTFSDTGHTHTHTHRERKREGEMENTHTQRHRAHIRTGYIHTNT